MSEPYSGLFLPVEPINEIPLDDAETFDCRRNALRHPRETKGMDYDETILSDSGVCDSSSGCC